MIAPLPQERAFKQVFDRNRLAAIRGDNFTVPEVTNNTHFFSEDENEPAANNIYSFSEGSEDGILAQYPLTSPLSQTMTEATLRPKSFSSTQQQARIAGGVDAPSLLPDNVAALQDPEYATEEEPVTYGESLAALEQQARGAEDIEEARAIGRLIKQKASQATDQFAEEMNKIIKEKASRLVAKSIGNGGNALGSVGWDGWITFIGTCIYSLARAGVSILSPETNTGRQKILHTFIPPYRLFREPGDSGYFLVMVTLGLLIFCLILAFFAVIVHFVFFPLFMPGGLLSP